MLYTCILEKLRELIAIFLKFKNMTNLETGSFVFKIDSPVNVSSFPDEKRYLNER